MNKIKYIYLLFLALMFACATKKQNAAPIETIYYKEVEIEQTVVQPDSVTEKTYQVTPEKQSNISPEKKARMEAIMKEQMAKSKARKLRRLKNQ
jgi:hypothetical protein